MKIVELRKLEKILQGLKSEGKKIVLCHGCFDLIHPGHIKHFRSAKKMGNILVVTITPDRFVNKGSHRPAFAEDLRVEVVAALSVVDYVAVNNWPTAIDTIKLLKPDIYVKGSEYKDYKKDVTGNIKLEEDAVRSVGGEIAFTSDIIFSSSKLINRHFSKSTDEQNKFLEKLKDKYTFNEITGYIDSLTKLRVLLVGEVIIDEYVFCNTIGKSGKEPILVNQKLDMEKYAGGILAIANHVADFCKEAKIISYLGERDSHEQFIKGNLEPNVELDYIPKSNSPTILKTRFIDSYTRTKTFGVYDLNDKLLEGENEEQFYSKLEGCIKDYDVIVVADYGHGLITPKIVNLLESESKYLAVNTQLNASNIGYHTISKYKQSNYVCIHEGELRHDYRNRTETVELLTKELSLRVKSDVIVITRGKSGSLAYQNNNYISCPTYTTEVVDRLGAGDTLLAITSLCFAVGIPADLTLFIGNLAAAEMVSSIGTGIKLKKMDLLKSIDSLLK